MSKKIVEQLLKLANISSDNLIIHDQSIYSRIVSNPSLELGQTYMEGLWELKNITIDELFFKISSTRLSEKLITKLSYTDYFWLLKDYLFTKRNPYEVAKHYDIGNELYSHMLDHNMQYSCAYFNQEGITLEEAQVEKMALIARKLKLNPKDKVLEIGFGYGTLAQFLAEYYGCHVDGITISKEQYKWAMENNKHPNKIRYMLCDYNEFKSDIKYDKIVSVGMFEHVGIENYQKYLEFASSMLKDGGIFLLHTIAQNKSKDKPDPWLNRYIFPNSILPSLAQIAKSSEELFVVEHLENLGVSYDKTLMNWYRRFVENFDEINRQRALRGLEAFDQKFYRMFEYYLLFCAGTFRSREAQLYQIILSKKLFNGYGSVTLFQ